MYTMSGAMGSFMQYFTFQNPPTFYIRYIYYIHSYCSAVFLLHVSSKLYITDCCTSCTLARIHADMSILMCGYECSPSMYIACILATYIISHNSS